MRVFNEAQGNFFASTASFVLPHLPRSPFRSYLVGDLATHVADHLLRSASAYLSLFRRMRLVNVKSWFTHFSYGLIDPEIAPAYKHLVFTFSIGYPQPLDHVRVRKRILSNQVVIYGTDENPAMYVAVGLNSVDAAKFRITNMQTRSLKYLYMAAGVVLRSIFRVHGRVDLDEDALASVHERLYRNVVSQRPLVNVFQLPYSEWAWQASVWRLCPNLVASRLINPWSVSRVLQVLDSTSIDYKNAAYDLIWDDDQSRDTVFSLVRTSLTRFISAVNTQDVSIPDQSGLLFPTLLYSLLFTGKVNYVDEAEQVYPDMVRAFNEREVDLASLFEPFDLTVRRMMRGDAATVAKLVKALDIFD